MVEGEREIDLGSEWLADWDLARDIIIRRRVQVDFDLAAVQLQLPADEIELSLLLRIGTGAGRMPRRINDRTVQVMDRENSDVLIEEAVRGSALSHRLIADTHLLLSVLPPTLGTLSPRTAGARLWTDRLDIRLEGEEPRFPMEIMSFGDRFAGRLDAHALWYLHWVPGNLDRDFGGAVRLFVNSDRPDFADRFIMGDRATLQVVLADTMLQLVGAALSHDDLDAIIDDAEEGSIASQVGFWMRLAFPGQKSAQVRSLLASHPARFHAALVAAADVAPEDLS